MHDYTPDPTVFHATIPLIDDSDTPDAGNFNPATEALADNLAHVRQGSLLFGALNWNPTSFGIGPGGTTQIMCSCAWDAFARSWLAVVGNGTGGVSLMVTKNGGLKWRLVNPDFATVYLPMVGQSVAVNPTTGAVVVVRIDAGTGNPYVSSRTSIALASSWTDVPQSTIAHSTALGACFFAPYSGGTGLFHFIGLTGAGAGSIASSTTSDGHGFWAAGPALPSAWATVSTSVAAYITAGTSTQTVVAMCGVTPGGSDRSRLLQHPTMADITPSFLTSGAEQVRGIAWGATDALWGVATVDAAGTTRVHTSPDLVTWTTAATLTNTVCAGIAAMGSTWALYAYQAGVNPLANVILLTSSITAATPVWVHADFDDATTGTILPSRNLPVGTLLSNGVQFLAAEMFNSATANIGAVTVSQRALVGT